MSKKELERKTLLEAYKCGKLTLGDVSQRIEVGYRQTKRIWKKYQNEGDIGLCHKNRGKTPPIAKRPEFKKVVLDLYKAKYMGFGPTYAAEKLLEDDGVVVETETLRLWLKKEGLWRRQRKREVYRERRARRPNFGDLIQIDGSIHKWFDHAESNDCLLNMVDDATGVTLAKLDKGETTKVLLETFKNWVEKYGIPKAVYVDLKSVYVSSKHLVEKYDDDLLIKNEFSVFQKVCKDLGIQIIKAYSPQAKGRVERKHGVFQDRLVKDIKLYNLQTIKEVNEYLDDKFLNKINYKFAYFPEGIGDSHRNCKPYGDLNQIFCWRYERKIKNDWTIQFKREYFQIRKEGLPESIKPNCKIIIKKYLNGQMRLWFGEKELNYYQLSMKPECPSKSKKYYRSKGGQDAVFCSHRARLNKHKTPWSQFTPGYFKAKNDKKIAF